MCDKTHRHITCLCDATKQNKTALKQTDAICHPGFKIICCKGQFVICNLLANTTFSEMQSLPDLHVLAFATARSHDIYLYSMCVLNPAGKIHFLT